MNESAQENTRLFNNTRTYLENLSVGQMDEQRGLHSNKAINYFTGFPEMGVRMWKDQSLGDAFTSTFYDEVSDEVIKDAKGVEKLGKDGKKLTKKVGKGFRWGKLAGSVWAAGTALSVAGGAVRGALTDKNGNFDIPGIPMI